MTNSGSGFFARMFDYTQQTRPISAGSYVYLLFAVLAVSLIPLLVHLDMTGFIEDEGIRNLVALEMKYSGNYITPTLFGEPYLNKPPLWNWILILTYQVAGGPSIFNARLANVFFLLLFSTTIFFGLRRHVGPRMALLNALMLLTCGRILFWDSMLSLIDICFSWVIFYLFLWIYHFGARSKYLALFTGAYAIATVGFFLKGLPALVFLGFTLVATLIYFRSWKKLISLEHFSGFALLAVAAGSYFLAYHQLYPAGELIERFFSESTKRTAAEHGFMETVTHLVSFPFNMLYHFFPWSLLVFFYFGKSVLPTLRKQQFLAWCIIVFVSNIWVYWTSPNVFPRYLFMFLPLLTTPALYLYFQEKCRTFRKLFDGFLMIFMVVFIVGSWWPVWRTDTMIVDHIVLKSSLLTVLFLVCLWMMVRLPPVRLFMFCFAMLIGRFGFDLFVLPIRGNTGWSAEIQKEGQRIAEKYKEKPLSILRFNHLNYSNGFYLTSERGDILVQTDTLVNGSYMIVEENAYLSLEQQYPVLDSLRLFGRDQYAFIIYVPEKK